MVSKRIKKRIGKIEVRHKYKGRFHHYDIKNERGVRYTINLALSCDCPFFTNFKGENDKICSHIAALLYQILKCSNLALEQADKNDETQPEIISEL